MYNRNFCVRISQLLFLILFCSAALISCSGNFENKKDNIEKISIPGEFAPAPLPEKEIQKKVFLEDINLFGLKESEVRNKIEELAVKINIEAKNAKLDERNWVVVEQEKPGKKVNVEKLVNTLFNAKEGAKVKLVTETVAPTITAKQLKSNIVEIGQFTTTLLDKRENRVNNISIASKKLDKMKVAPGEQFSFNDALGKRTEAKGYEEAPIIIKTEDGFESADGIGGGICQLSTTLYNAAEKASMKITERHAHSKEVKYVPKGKDATVSYGSSDLKFVNIRNYPVMIRTYMGKNSVTVKLFENRN
ncbi:MAG: hypothetical protein K0R31_1686 [Clostridiales bacterium]|jgi:vancomycin resistance protein YoaR|nr:hypothetical protein [Clostridiales bacterium]